MQQGSTINPFNLVVFRVVLVIYAGWVGAGWVGLESWVDLEHVRRQRCFVASLYQQGLQSQYMRSQCIPPSLPLMNQNRRPSLNRLNHLRSARRTYHW